MGSKYCFLTDNSAAFRESQIAVLQHGCFSKWMGSCEFIGSRPRRRALILRDLVRHLKLLLATERISCPRPSGTRCTTHEEPEDAEAARVVEVVDGDHVTRKGVRGRRSQAASAAQQHRIGCVMPRFMRRRRKQPARATAISRRRALRSSSSFVPTGSQWQPSGVPGVRCRSNDPELFHICGKLAWPFLQKPRGLPTSSWREQIPTHTFTLALRHAYSAPAFSSGSPCLRLLTTFGSMPSP